MKKDDKERLIREIADQLQQEPALSNPTRIIIDFERRGPLFRKRDTVKIEGKVKDQIESEKALNVVQTKVGNSVEIDNNLTFQQ